MCFAYVLPDTTPRVGIPQNGKQAISVHDNTGVRATYVASTENIDKFLKTRASVQRTSVLGLLTTCAAAIGGTLIASAEKFSKSTKIGAGIALGAVALLSWLPCYSASKQYNSALADVKNDSLNYTNTIKAN